MESIDAILIALPPRPPRTALEPYAAVIVELVNRGWSYRDIAKLLGDRFNLATSRSSVHRLVKRQNSFRQTVSPMPSGSQNQRAEDPNIVATRDPADTTAEPFRFDADEPLRLPESNRRPNASRGK